MHTFRSFSWFFVLCSLLLSASASASPTTEKVVSDNAVAIETEEANSVEVEAAESVARGLSSRNSGFETLISAANASQSILKSPIESINDFGDHYDVSSGSVTFKRTDISIPGNSKLSVSYSISHPTSFSSITTWIEDIPKIEMTYGNGDSDGNNMPISWRDGLYCSGSQKYNRKGTKEDWNSLDIDRELFFSRARLIVPEHEINEKLLNNTGILSSNISIEKYPYTTRSNWRLACYTSATTGKEGFKATSPSGDTYYFDIPARRQRNIVGGSLGTAALDSTPPDIMAHIIKDYRTLFVSKIEDKHGNWVNYEYEVSDRYWPEHIDMWPEQHDIAVRLKSISSNDNRRITVSRTDNTVAVSSTGETWRYTLDIDKKDRIRGVRNHLLIEQPNGLTWDYKLTSPTLYGADSNNQWKCLWDYYPAWHVNSPMTVINSQGAIATFDFDFVSSHFSNAGPNTGPCSYTYALMNKTINGNQLPITESYTYSETLGTLYFQDNNPPKESLLSAPVPTTVDRLNYKLVTKVASNGSTTKFYVNRRARSGLLGTIGAIEYSNTHTSPLALTELRSYHLSDAKGLSGTSYWDEGESDETTPRLTSIEYQYDGATGVTTYYSDYNRFDAPETTSISDSSMGLYRSYKTTYEHDYDAWVLNLPKYEFTAVEGSIYKQTKASKYSVTSPFMLKKATGMLSNHISNIDYHSDGNVKKITYLLSNRYIQYDNYYRGKPRKVTLPCSITNGCDTTNGSSANTIVALYEFNSDGTTKNVTDFNGRKTNYSYNNMGWLTKIDHVDPKWTDTLIDYHVVTTANDGIAGSHIAVGQLRQTVTQGNYENTIYHDGLLRPTFTRTRDKTNPATVSYQRTQYDHESRPTLQSFPSNNASNTVGMLTKYDALGRTTSITRQSDNATSNIEYLSGYRQQVTDAKNNVTTTTYLPYRDLSNSLPVTVETPDSDDIHIEYNEFDQVTSITQGEVTETRLYDNEQHLCKTYRPETGATVHGYNAMRQPIWRAEGLGGGNNSCTASSVSASDKVLLDYDHLGRLNSENYPDSTPDKTYRYDANGNLTYLIAGSGNNAISWSYLYNSLNLVEKETLALDGKNYVLDWEYNNLGAVSSLRYPSGRTISYAPNALGQATQAAEGSHQYASHVTYHPNGQLKQLTYGNGIVRNVALDTTGRIDAISDSKGASYLLRLDPSYDQNDNLIGLIDWVDRNNDIDNMSFDGVNRLLTADGKWGRGSYSYDGLGNILSRSISGSTIHYNYNNLNRLNNIRGAYGYTYGYDTRGNVIHNGRYGLSFNRANQVSTAKGIPYRYDGHNRRVKKNNNYSVYSQAGQLLYRQKANNDKIDSVYLGKQLIADIESR
ncbi:hypothetical protein HWQ46_26640 [Shewanella sp. D64]|uniref:RHS repeat domain-containing protein n=1 Tax=unclassified Shewanella TaxID=196818 RepID=UPI0022BA40F3|nr:MULTISPECIES: hypothetical protein [unclassified Shewanella]MEC4729087.1 hypothetical protein [Shewanella sp. D64]MEC4740883.1 hypothetical protein [Shewanella sp. E94]WBJ96696.1 hypothetical protein HWQ47_06155 [Shewanella sp. MTB7]